MKTTFLQRLWCSLCLILLLGWGNAAWAATTYKLTQVTSVQAGEKYVFEQGGYVMNNTISSSALQTTATYKKTGLTGTETYVWTLVTATDGFYMKNESSTSEKYLKNTSSTNLSFETKSGSSVWSFSFAQSGTATITTSNRFLGYTTSTSYVYKAYATGSESTYPHAITVYKLEEEAKPSHTVTFSINAATTSSEVEEDAAIPFPSNPADINGMTFVGWSTTTISGTTNVEPTLVTSATMGSSDVTYYAVFASASMTQGTRHYKLNYSEETRLSSSNEWGFIGTAYSYTANDGGQWVIKAAKNVNGAGLQINTGMDCSIKVPVCSSNIISIELTGNTDRSVGFSSSDYDGNSTITYLAYGANSYTQTIDLSGCAVTTGYIVPKGGSISISSIVVNYTGDVTVYSNYCTTVKNANTITTTFETNTTVYGTPLNGSVATTAGYDGAVSASSSNTSVATVSIDGEGNVTVTPVSVGTAVITFSAPETSVYMAADNVAETITVTAPAAQTSSAGASSPTVTIAASGYGTYCCDYPLDFSVDNENYKAWYVSGVTGNTVTFTQIKGQITGGVPFILYGTPGTYDLTLATTSEATLSGNMLRGTLAPTYVETIEGDNMNFGLSGGKFVRIANGVLPAYKAFLPLPASQYQKNSNARLSIVFADEVVTDIETARRAALNEQHVVCDLQGRRVSQPQRGLYIKDGKKVLVNDKR